MATDHYVPGSLHVIARGDEGGFEVVSRISFGSLGDPMREPPTSVTAADMDADGRVDLVLSVPVDEQVFVCRQTGALNFERCRGFSAGPTPVHVQAGDLDLDGDADLAVGNGNRQVHLLFNRSSPATHADADGDGRPDRCGPR